MRAAIIFAALVIGLIVPAPAGAARVVVVGLDETGSYANRDRALVLLGQVIEQLSPDDVLYLRRITEASYADACSVFRLVVPPLPARSANAFDRRSKAAHKKALNDVESVKARAIAYLAKEYQPAKAKKTDIHGFIAAAADRLAMHAGAERKVVILASDMVDNVDHRPEKCDLAGAEVFIMGFEAGTDPRKARKLRDGWTAILDSAGAGRVSWLPADMPLVLPE